MLNGSVSHKKIRQVIVPVISITKLSLNFSVDLEFQNMHSDQGREFESLRFQAVCHRLDLDKTRTTPHRSQNYIYSYRMLATFYVFND
jgi:hypothetical protein